MMTKKTVQVLSLALIAYLVVAPGTDRASAYERKFYKDTPEFNDEHYVVSPYQDVDNPHLTTVYEAPWKSKGLVPVKLTLKEKLAPLVLFADGKPKAKIITIKSSAYYLDCATLVKKYLDLATGGSFEIVDDDGTIGRPGIYIGPLKNEFSAAAAQKAQDFKYDGFNVVSFANGIALCGKEADPKYGFKKNLHPGRRTIRLGRSSFSRGTVMASLDFLERFIGIRWYCPGRVGVFIPDLKKRKVVVPAVSYRDEPVFGFRKWNDEMYQSFDKMYIAPSVKYSWVHNALRRRSRASLSIGNHTDCYWHKFYAGKPEYFAMRKDGTRMMGEKGDQSSQRCYGSEAGFRQHVKDIDNWYRYGDRTGEEHKKFTYRHCTPNDRYIYWFPNDGFPGCFCETCRKLSAKYSQYRPKYIQELHYLKKLAGYAAEKWPGKVVVYNLYGAMEIPAGIELPRNVILSKVFHGVPEVYWKEPKYLKFTEDLVDDLYKRSVGEVVMYHHYPQHIRIENLEMPYLAPHVLSNFYRKNREKLGGLVLDQWHMVLAHDVTMLYLFHSIAWNPDVDPDGVIDEYSALMFGPAAKEMKAYHDLLIDRWENVKWSYSPDVKLRYGAGPVRSMPKSVYWTENYPTNVRAKLQALLRGALKKTTRGSIYHDRMVWYNGATKKFFTQGRHFDENVAQVAECDRVQRPITIDGSLDDWAGRDTLVLKESMTGKDTKLRTEFMTAYDDRHVYVAGRVFEPDRMVLPPKPLKRDGPVYHHDSIEIFLCPNRLGDDEAQLNQRGRFYQIMLNARGEFLDSHMPLHSRELNTKFDMALEHKEKPMGNGFQFEIKLPFTAMGALAPKPGESWAVNFYRNRKRDDGSERYYAWSPTMGQPFFKTETFGVLEFPLEPLFEHEVRDPSIWARHVPDADVQLSTKDGVTTFKVKYPADARGPALVGFYAMGNAAKIEKPISAKWPIRFNGKGVKTIQAWMRSKDWEKLQVEYNPSANPAELAKTQDWTTLNLRETRDRKGAKIENISDFYALGITVNMTPGAEFSLECKNVKVYEE